MNMTNVPQFTPPMAQTSTLDLLQSMAQSVGSNSTFSGQLAAVNTVETSEVPDNMKSAPQAPPRATQYIPDLPGIYQHANASNAAAASTSGAQESNSGPQHDPFQVNKSALRIVPVSQQAEELQNLGLTVYNQQEFEDDIMNQVDKAFEEEEKTRMKKMLGKSLKAVQEDIRCARQEITKLDQMLNMFRPQLGKQNIEFHDKIESVKKKLENKQKQLKKLKAKEKSLEKKLSGNTEDKGSAEDIDEDDAMLDAALGLTTRKETEAERMIRLGEMTPFGTAMTQQEKVSPGKPTASAAATSRQMSGFEKYLTDQLNKNIQQKKAVKKKLKSSAALRKSKSSSDMQADEPKAKKKKIVKAQSSTDLQNKEYFSTAEKKKKQLSNRFDEKDKRKYVPLEKDFSHYKQRNRRYKLNHMWSGDPDVSDHSGADEDMLNTEEDEWRPGKDDYMDEEEDQPYGTAGIPQTKRKRGGNKGSKSSRKAKGLTNSEDSLSSGEFDITGIKAEFGVKNALATGGSAGGGNRRSKDDGDDKNYKKRLQEYKRKRLRKKQLQIIRQDDPDAKFSDLDDEDSSDSDDEQDMKFESGFRVPGKIWKKLYRYQKTGVKWLWELHMQQAGGIVGDEMGLGKTIQTIAFLSGLKHSKLRDRGSNTRYKGLGPTLIVCPTTIMHQWVREFHQWAPLFRVAILHSSGSYGTSADHLISSIAAGNGVIVTSYSTMVIHQDSLLEHDWHYVVLDEGHKIRNPDAQVTLAAKQFRTCHRIILSGSPVQNNLKELWSLFDFVFPGKLGTLPDFLEHFSVPIVQGGYANATEIQVQTAYKCSCVLRDTINPYLLRRMKADVKTNLQLPNKNEQVLFCRLTEEQKDVYREYLDSKECNMILSGNFMVFPGLITLRKICNHPDIGTGGPKEWDQDYDAAADASQYGYFKRSGKMIVVESLLKLWRKQGHRVLIFTQSKQMLDILEIFVKNENYNYMRMDGGTSISSRQPLIAKFNNDPSYFVFLLTTRVGGLGVNLTGANRVVIFDPDWNPSTDLQARERAWRIGQKKQVTIYRLLTTGTIEEKIYHRQIFKQFLTNRVLKDPKQRRFFKSNDLFELFTLGDDNRKMSTETSAIFAGTGSDVRVKIKKNNKEDMKDVDKECTKKRRNRFDEKMEQELQEDDANEKQQVLEKEKVVDETDPKKESNKGNDLTDDNNTRNSANNEDDDDDGDCGISAARMRELKELAKKLSRKLMDERKQSKDTEKEDKKDTATSTVPESLVKENSDSNESSGAQKTDNPPDKCVPSSAGKTEETPKIAATRKEKNEHKKEKKKKHKEKEKKKHKSKKKKKEPVDAVFEGEKINHLERHEAKKLEEDLEQEAESSQQDDYVLQNLFKQSGAVHSAMQHDKIMMSSNPDYALVEAEADRVAKGAAKALKDSRARCFGARTGVPTWTGSSGAGGAPPKPRFGQKKNTQLLNRDPLKSKDSPVKKPTEKQKESVIKPKLFDGSVAGNLRTNAASASAATPHIMSSTELLSRMKSRNHLALGEAESDEDEDDDQYSFRRSTSSAIGIKKEDLELITDIRNYVAYQAHMDGRASTEELLSEFKSRIPTEESAKFKSMLKQVCDFDKVGGVGLWFLKGEFK